MQNGLIPAFHEVVADEVARRVDVRPVVGVHLEFRDVADLPVRHIGNAPVRRSLVPRIDVRRRVPG